MTTLKTSNFSGGYTLTDCFTLIILISLSSLSILSTVAYASVTDSKIYKIQGFSDDYHATVTPTEPKNLNDSDDADDYENTNAIIKLINQQTGKTLLSQPSYIDIEYELDNGQEHNLDGKISANIVNMPYGEHSILIYQDMNFDGIKDIALNDGQYGCYGGKSYQVYLANKEGTGFTHSNEFSDLAHSYCSFFGIDNESKTLSTMTKSGCCWHEYSEYKLINGRPIATHIFEEGIDIGKNLYSITESTLVSGKMVKNEYDMLINYDEMGESKADNVIYAVEFENGKQLVIDSGYKEDSEYMYYAFADKEGKVELFYDGDFSYDCNTKTLSFTNKPVVYQVTQQGITVKLAKNKTVLLKAKSGSQVGDLDKVMTFENVKVKNLRHQVNSH